MTTKVTSRNDQRFCVYTFLREKSQIAKHPNYKYQRQYSPAVGNKGGKLIQAPSKSINHKHTLNKRQLHLVAHNHDNNIQREQDNKLTQFQNGACTRHNQPVLVQQRRLSGVIQRNRPQLIVVWDNIPLRRGRVDDAALVDCRDDALAGSRAEKVLTFRQDGHLERREGPAIAAKGALVDLCADVGG